MGGVLFLLLFGFFFYFTGELSPTFSSNVKSLSLTLSLLSPFLYSYLDPGQFILPSNKFLTFIYILNMHDHILIVILNVPFCPAPFYIANGGLSMQSIYCLFDLNNCIECLSQKISLGVLF